MDNELHHRLAMAKVDINGLYGECCYGTGSRYNAGASQMLSNNEDV